MSDNHLFHFLTWGILLTKIQMKLLEEVFQA